MLITGCEKYFFLLAAVFVFSCSAPRPPAAFLPAKEIVSLNQLIYKDSIGNWLPHTGSNYQLVWEPEAVNGNYAVVFKNKTSEQYAVVVRGSLLELSQGALQNWIQDFNIFNLKKWIYTDTVQNAYISNGSFEGFQNLLRLRDKHTGDRLTDCLQKIPPTASVIISGHSLGGNLAQVLASYLWQQTGLDRRKQLNVVSFGATAVGNRFFVQDLEEKFPNGERYEIDKDIAPKFPDPEQLAVISGIVGLDSIPGLSVISGEKQLLSRGLELLATLTKELKIIPKENNYAQSKKHLKIIKVAAAPVSTNNGNAVSRLADQIYRYHKIDGYADYFAVKPLQHTEKKN
jgi:hypothetical protein